MSLILVTGTGDDNRVTSRRVGALNAGLFGEGIYAVNGSFLAELRGHNVVISAGTGLVEGRHFAIEGNESVDVSEIALHSDKTGYIYLEYARSVDGSETMAIRARQGSLNESGSILAGDFSARRALLYVDMSGNSIEPMYTEIRPLGIEIPATEKYKVREIGSDLGTGIQLDANKEVTVLEGQIEQGIYVIRGKAVFGGTSASGKDMARISIYETNNSYGYDERIHSINTELQLMPVNFVNVTRDTVIRLSCKSSVARKVKEATIRLLKLM